MRVRVRLFAVAKQLAGRDAVELELPDGATVADLRSRLAEALPQASDLMARVMFAIDRQYADDAAPIPDGAEVACIPPVSGG